jgi:ankyrin repeat protein
MIALGTSPRMLYSLLANGRAQQPDDEGSSPLAIAVKMKVSRATLESIVTLGGRVGAVDREGKTPLRIAVDMDNRDAARYLVEAGSDVFQLARDGLSPAEEVLRHDTESIRAVFAGRANVVDSSGNTILHYAARMASPDATRFLLSLGADKSIKNTAGELPYDIAVRWGNTEVAALLQ